MKKKTNIIKNCKFCKKKFSAHWYAAKKKYVDFCSRNCIDNWQRRKQKKIICKNCKKKFYLRPSKIRGGFCSWKCYMSFRQKSPKQKISDGFIYKVHNNIVKHYGKTHCSLCGYDKCPGILQTHHIDGDKNNNVPENLLCVCPNCHSEIHYKTGTGNFWQRKVS